jgi:CHAT domain-containing protein
MLGLVRGIVLAGARTVLASLWRVDDRATRGFMRRLYSRWRATGTLGRALAEVQRSEGGASRNAYHWAPFHIVGDPAFPWPKEALDPA